MEQFLTSILPVAAFAVLWTIVVRKFPEILSSGIIKRIEHNYDVKIEKLKGEIQANVSTMQSSIDFLTVSQSEYRHKIISSIDCLWLSIQACQNVYSSVMFLHNILSPDEIRELIDKNDNIKLQHILDEYSDSIFVIEKTKEIECKLTGIEVLYVSSRLWNLYRAVLLVHGRAAVLLNQSITRNMYQDWRQDRLMLSAISDIVSEENISDARERMVGGLNDILNWIIADFIKEASNLLRSPMELKESVLKIYSVLKKTATKPSDD